MSLVRRRTFGASKIKTVLTMFLVTAVFTKVFSLCVGELVY